MKCYVCGKEVDDENSFVAGSPFGAYSNRYCKECLEKSLEPYNDMVSYIACAGHFPEDINEEYQKYVRYLLKELNISEEQFIKDVEKSIQQWDDYINNLSPEEIERIENVDTSPTNSHRDMMW